MGAKIPRHRQRHGSDAAFRCRVGHLTDLTFKGRNRRRIDHDPTFTIGIGFVRCHVLGRNRINVEGRNQVQVDDAPEVGQRVARTILLDRSLCNTAAGGIDHEMQAA